MKKFLFPALCAVATILLFSVGGVVLGGILMGIVSTIAIWMSIQRMPEGMKAFMCKNKFTVVMSDLVFLKLTAAIMLLLGSGVTVFVAIMTQMVLLGLLIDNMKHQEIVSDGDDARILVLEPSR